MPDDTEAPVYERRLYIDQQGGRVVCYQHLGGYGRADVKAEPDAPMWITPLDVWTVATVAENEDWLKHLGHPLNCEDCGKEFQEEAP